MTTAEAEKILCRKAVFGDVVREQDTHDGDPDAVRIVWWSQIRPRCDECGDLATVIFKSTSQVQDWFWIECVKCEKFICDNCVGTEDGENGDVTCCTCNTAPPNRETRT